MSVEVSIKELADEMDCQSDERFAYLNKKTGKTVLVAAELLSAAEADSDEESDDDDTEDDEGGEFSEMDWDPEEINEAKEIVNSGDYLRLPDRLEINEYRIMQAFINTLEDEKAAGHLAISIQGSGAFRRFNDTAHFLGIIDKWYEFKKQALEEIAIEWCEANEIRFKRP